MDTILVTGATGNLGNAVVEALLEKGLNVRAATRHTTKIKWTDRVRPVLFDYEDQGLHKAALDNVSGVFLIAPPLDYRAPEKLIPFIDKAKTMEVRHIVFNSAFKANSDEQNPLSIVEQYLMRSGLDFTILRPNFFMENFSTGWLGSMILSNSGMWLPADDAETSFISVADIARVVAVCFQERRSGEQYNLTGNKALSYGEAARIISDVCGRTVTYNPISETEFREGARKQGLSENAIQYMAQLFALVRKGLMAEVTDTVRKVTGKIPISFNEFAEKTAHIWKMRKAA